MRACSRVAPFLLLVSILGGCCNGPPLVVLGPPQQRYDHVRTAEVREWVHVTRRPVEQPDGTLALAEGEATIRLPWGEPLERANTPYGHRSFPSGGGRGEDGLHAGHLVPVFTGVQLPLAGDEVRRDLLDYLGTWPNVAAGIVAPEMPGDLVEETERTYRGMLGFLADARNLKTRAAVERWAEAHDTGTTTRIADSRYSMSSFDVSHTVAVLWENFWFVLYRLPGKAAFSRLVVIPTRLEGQDFGDKAPGGGER